MKSMLPYILLVLASIIILDKLELLSDSTLSLEPANKTSKNDTIVSYAQNKP